MMVVSALTWSSKPLTWACSWAIWVSSRESWPRRASPAGQKDLLLVVQHVSAVHP